ncbi:MAG TPA: hypothetical protein VI386_25800 [Candidatus Sulfotelmatobacter sp.]
MGTIKAIIGFLAIIAVVYGAFQIVPPEMNNYSFQDDLRQIAVMAGGNPHESDDDLRSAVLLKAKSHDIALTPEQVVVQRIGTPGVPAVYVAADYTVPVSLLGYDLTLHFTPTSGNKGF